MRRNTFFIKDKAGSGKTNLLCRLANQAHPQTLTMFLSCKFDLPPSHSLEEILLKSLYVSFEHQCKTRAYEFRIPKDPADLFELLILSLQKHNHELVVFLDGVNENRDLSALDEAIIYILSRWNGLPIKFVVTCRDIFWGFFGAEQWARFFYKKEIYDLPGFDESQVDTKIPAGP